LTLTLLVSFKKLTLSIFLFSVLACTCTFNFSLFNELLFVPSGTLASSGIAKVRTFFDSAISFLKNIASPQKTTLKRTLRPLLP